MKRVCVKVDDEEELKSRNPQTDQKILVTTLSRKPLNLPFLLLTFHLFLFPSFKCPGATIFIYNFLNPSIETPTTGNLAILHSIITTDVCVPIMPMLLEQQQQQSMQRSQRQAYVNPTSRKDISMLKRSVIIHLHLQNSNSS